jgi:hypothetical protein
VQILTPILVISVMLYFMLLLVLCEDLVDVLLLIESFDDLLGLFRLPPLDHLSRRLRAEDEDQNCLQDAKHRSHRQDYAVEDL